jgi:hypothetical protein
MVASQVGGAVSAQCQSTDDGARCVFGEGHKVDYHSDGSRQWFGAVCDVCGNEAGSGRVMSEIEVCRLCYASVEERARVREEERDVYRAALADMVAGLDGARARAVDVLRGNPALCGQCPHPPHQGPCLASVDPAGLTAHTRDKVCPCGIAGAPEPHDEVAAEIAEKAEDDECWGYADRADPDEWRGAARTREDAIAEGRGYFGSDATFWIASGTRATPAHYLPSWREFEENLNQSVADNSSCPDGVDDPFEFREGAEEAFTSMLEDWAEKYMAEANWWEMDGKPERIDPLPVIHKYRPNTAGHALCGVVAPVEATTSTDRKDTTCPACLRLWIDPGVVKAMAGGDSAARFGDNSPPEGE